MYSERVRPFLCTVVMVFSTEYQTAAAYDVVIELAADSRFSCTGTFSTVLPLQPSPPYFNQKPLLVCTTDDQRWHCRECPVIIIERVLADISCRRNADSLVAILCYSQP